MSTATSIVEVSAAWLAAEKAKPSTAMLHVDVRRIDELQADGRIPGAVHVPLHLLSKRHLSTAPVILNSAGAPAVTSSDGDTEQPLVVFSCASGKRSMVAARKAVDEWGLTKVASLTDGFRGWKESGQQLLLGGGSYVGQPFVKCWWDQSTGTCQFIVVDNESRAAAIIDPVLDFDLQACKASTTCADALLAYCSEHELDVQYILETHAHADHLSASQYLKAKLGGKPQICIGEGITAVQKTFGKVFAMTAELHGDGSEFDKLFKAGETFMLGSLEGKAMHVPGHTPDHLCYLVGESVFAGDSIFMPDSGSARCDFPGGSATQLFNSIRGTLFALPDSTRIFVGHDYQPGGRKLAFETTVGEQKMTNKHVKEDVSEQEFIKMREERDKTLGNPKLLFPSLQVNIRAGRMPTRKSEGSSHTLFTLPVTAPKM